MPNENSLETAYLREQIDGLKVQLASSQQTPWGTIGAIGAIIAAVVVAFLGLINSRFDAVNLRIDGLDRHDSELIVRIEKTDAESVRRSELLATKEALNTEIQAAQRHVEESNLAIATINADLVRRRAEFVEQTELRALEKRIDEMLHALASRIDMRLTIAVFEAWKSERDRRIEQIEQRK